MVGAKRTRGRNGDLASSLVASGAASHRLSGFDLYPLMSTMQMISARIGRVTGHELAANMRRIFPAWAVTSLVTLLFIANTINIGAGLAAMGAAAELVLGMGATCIDAAVRRIFADPSGAGALSPLRPVSKVADLGAGSPILASSSQCRSTGARSPCER